MATWLEIAPPPTWGPGDRCWSCGEPLPTVPVAHACGECGHAWITDGNLRLHDAARRGTVGMTLRPVEEILSCPCCAHDL